MVELAAWIRHPLSTEHNLTPLQLWVQGNFENACFQQTVSNSYGIQVDYHMLDSGMILKREIRC